MQPTGTSALNITALYKLMCLRGITTDQLEAAGGPTTATLNRIRRGRVWVRPSTVRKIVTALSKYPVLEHAELLLAPVEKTPDSSGHDADQLPDVLARGPLRELRPNEGVPPDFVGDLRVIEDKMPRAHKPAASP